VPKTPQAVILAKHRRATSHEIARAAGVSQATVSNVINRPELVSPATREKVIRAMESMDFVINRSAQTLRSGTATSCGLVVLDIANPFWAELTRGVESVTAPLGQSVIVASSGESQDAQTRQVAQLESQGVRGILVAPVGDELEQLRAVQRRGTEVVLLDHADPEDQLPSVTVDHVAGARSAAAHLFGMGHRLIAFVNGPHRIPWCRDRSLGVQTACEAAGVSEFTEITVPSMTFTSGRASVDTVLAADGVTAVFCANDMIAMGLLKGLMVRGIRVPEDLSLVGYDDADFSELLSPALTTVRQSPIEIGQHAARLLYGADAAVDGILGVPELVVRDSVAQLRRPS
jgi:LacI family transcriptional regulator